MKSKNIKIISMGMLLLSMVACNTSSNSSSSTTGTSESEIKEVSLSFWHGFTGTDGDNMNSIVNAFNQEYAGRIKIEVNRLDWDTLFTKFYQNKKNPRFSPNVIAVPANRLGSVLQRDMIIPMNDIMDNFSLTESDFISSAYNVGVVDGNRYSFPLDVHPTALFYNKEITGELKAYSTWDEFYAACKTFTNGDVYGWAIPNNYSITKDIFYSQLLQNKTDIIDFETNAAIFNSQTAVELLTKMTNIKYGDNAVSPSNVSNGGDLTLFRAGKSAFYFDGPWMIKTLKESCDFAEYGNLGILPIPGSTGESGVSFSGSHQLCLAKNTVTTDEIKNASYIFLNYLSENSIEWAKAGQVPARKSVHESDEYKALDYLDVFTETALNAKLGKASYQYFYEMYNYMGTGVSQALNNNYSPKDALDTYVNNYNRWLKEQ